MGNHEQTYVDLQPRMVPGNDGTPEIEVPRVIPWERLPADEYQERLADLAQWAQWLVDTYRWPATVLPDCWPLHADMREDLGHLHASWLFSRHPNTNVGTAGSDWDSRREAAEARLQRMVQLAGCGSSRGHVTREQKPRPATDAALLAEHVNADTEWRHRAQAAVDSADYAGQLAAAVSAAVERVLAQEQEKRTENGVGEEPSTLVATAAFKAARAVEAKVAALVEDDRNAAVLDRRRHIAGLFIDAYRRAIASDSEVGRDQLVDALRGDPLLFEAIERWAREVDEGVA